MYQSQATNSRFRSFLTVTLLFASIILGCKGSDPAPATDLSGNYKITAYTATSGTQVIDYVALASAFGSKCIQDLVITFKPDATVATNNPPTCATDDTDDSFKGAKWAVSGSTFSMTPTAEPKEDWAYVMAGNKLTLTRTETINSVAGTYKMELTKQ